MDERNNQNERENAEQNIPESEYSEVLEAFNAKINKKRPKFISKAQWFMIGALGIGLFIIIFAFANEARANREADKPFTDHALNRREVQSEINRLNWVEQDLLPVNPFSRPGTKLTEITGIVIHNIGNPNTTAQQNRNYFANLATTEERHASSNFIICLDGRILQCVPVDEIAYASNQRNDDTISIEICHPDDTGEFTPESYAAAVRLTAWLCAKFWLSAEDVIRHFDVQGKECPRFFVNNPSAWEQFKADVQKTIDEG